MWPRLQIPPHQPAAEAEEVPRALSVYDCGDSSTSALSLRLWRQFHDRSQVTIVETIPRVSQFTIVETVPRALSAHD